MKLIYKAAEVGGSTSANYPDQLNKPKINGAELVGNLTTEGAGITWFGTQAEYDAIASKDPNTLYIIDNGSSVVVGQNYLDLNNKPSIEGQILTGNKTAGDLNMYNIHQIDNMLASMRSIKVVATLPGIPTPGTMYYVGPDPTGFYHVYLYDSLGNQIDLGTTQTSVYTATNGIELDINNVFSLKNDANSIIVNSEGKVEAATMVGATATANGNKGIVPKPLAGDEKKLLKADGTWTDDYIPLSGNSSSTPMTGALYIKHKEAFRTAKDSDEITFYASPTKVYGATSLFSMYGTSNSLKGTINLSACDGTNRKDLVMKPNGQLTWGGTRILPCKTTTAGTYTKVTVNADGTITLSN